MARALLIVDFQNDFTPGGALAVPEGDTIAPKINALAGSGDYELVVATRDWHPADHHSFAAQGGPWPVHCVAGARAPSCTRISTAANIDIMVDKGQAVDTDGYSGFEGTDLESSCTSAASRRSRSSASRPTTASRTPRWTRCAPASRSPSTAARPAGSRSRRAIGGALAEVRAAGGVIA